VPVKGVRHIGRAGRRPRPQQHQTGGNVRQLHRAQAGSNRQAHPVGLQAHAFRTLINDHPSRSHGKDDQFLAQLAQTLIVRHQPHGSPVHTGRVRPNAELERSVTSSREFHIIILAFDRQLSSGGHDAAGTYRALQLAVKLQGDLGGHPGRYTQRYRIRIHAEGCPGTQPAKELHLGVIQHQE